MVIAFRELWRRETPFTRCLLTLGVVVVAMAVLSTVLVFVVAAVGGGWRLWELADNAVQLSLAWLGFSCVYWRRRALDAEKPMAMVRDFRAHFEGKQSLADIERWREQQSKALDL